MVYGTISYQQEPVRNDLVSVGTTVTSVAEVRSEDTPRKVICIRNTSDDPSKIITVTYGLVSPTGNYGIVLRQYESFTDSNDGDYQCFQGHINAVCAVAGGQVSILER
jgi:hypothetical protein